MAGGGAEAELGVKCSKTVAPSRSGRGRQRRCGASVEGDEAVEAQPVELGAEAAVPAMERREKEEGSATEREAGKVGLGESPWRRRYG